VKAEPRETFTLMIADVGDADDAPPGRRLAGVLKALLRAWGFKCVSVAPAAPPQAVKTETEFAPVLEQLHEH
jgi:hypothetical protein